MPDVAGKFLDEDQGPSVIGQGRIMQPKSFGDESNYSFEMEARFK